MEERVKAAPKPYGLSDMMLADFHQLFSRFPAIREVWIYGSRARGDHGPASDIDLAVVAPAMNDSQFAKMCWLLEDLPVLYQVDILHWDTLENAPLKKAIQSERKPFYPQITAQAHERVSDDRDLLFPLTRA